MVSKLKKLKKEQGNFCQVLLLFEVLYFHDETIEINSGKIAAMLLYVNK